MNLNSFRFDSREMLPFHEPLSFGDEQSTNFALPVRIREAGCMSRLALHTSSRCPSHKTPSVCTSRLVKPPTRNPCGVFTVHGQHIAEREQLFVFRFARHRLIQLDDVRATDPLCPGLHRIRSAGTRAAPPGSNVRNRVIGDVARRKPLSRGLRPMQHRSGNCRRVLDQLLHVLAADRAKGMGKGCLEARNDLVDQYEPCLWTHLYFVLCLCSSY